MPDTHEKRPNVQNNCHDGICLRIKGQRTKKSPRRGRFRKEDKTMADNRNMELKADGQLLVAGSHLPGYNPGDQVIIHRIRGFYGWEIIGIAK